jgi:hypothetical protein
LARVTRSAAKAPVKKSAVKKPVAKKVKALVKKSVVKMATKVTKKSAVNKPVAKKTDTAVQKKTDIYPAAVAAIRPNGKQPVEAAGASEGPRATAAVATSVPAPAPTQTFRCALAEESEQPPKQNRVFGGFYPQVFKEFGCKDKEITRVHTTAGAGQYHLNDKACGFRCSVCDDTAVWCQVCWPASHGQFCCGRDCNRFFCESCIDQSDSVCMEYRSGDWYCSQSHAPPGTKFDKDYNGEYAEFGDFDDEDSDDEGIWDRPVQCQGYTQKGARCKVTSEHEFDNATPLQSGSRYCKSHGGS